MGRLAVDISNWSGFITPESAECWKRNGIEFVVCGTQRQGTTRQQLEVASRAGLEVEAYVYLYWGYDVALQVQAALEIIRPYPVKRLWLDCEADASVFGPERSLERSQGLVSAIRRAEWACRGFPTGIYSGYWWWGPNMLGSQDFAHLPLWIADYDNVPALDSPELVPGWKPTTKQYTNTTSLCEVSVCRDYREETEVPTVEERLLVIEEELRAIRIGMAWINAARAYHEADEDAHLNARSLQEMDERLARMGR